MERGKRKKKPKYSLARNLVYYFGALRKFNGRVIYMVVFGILFGVLGTWLTMYIPKLILDRLEYSDGFTEIFFVIAGIFVANLLCNLVCDGIDAQKRYYNSDTWAYFNSLFEKKRLTIDYEYLQDPNIQIMKGKAWEAVRNSYSLTSIFPTTLANLGFNFICFILFGGVLGALNPLIILVLVAACVISYLPQKRLLAYMHGIKDASEAQARRLYYYSSLCRNFKIAKDVRLYAMSGWINRASAAAVRGYKRILLARENRRFAASAAEYGVALLRDGAAYAYLIWRAVSGDISAGDFVLYFSAISGFNSWFSGILDHWSSVQLTSLQICDLREYLEIKDKFNHGPGVPPPPKGEPVEIRLENVGYTYPEAEAPALKNINLTIRGGEKLAVVGLNGAGKTTLVKLICGLYTPTEGRILVCGHEIDEYNREEYYSLIAAVFQSSNILPASVAENIALCPTAGIDRARLGAALALSGLSEKVESLPRKADTPLNKTVHPDGVDLSGGETQKLLFARAVYKDAPVLVLDEPTSALDPLAESRMYENYNNAARDKTSVFISHRLASTRFCDRIAYLADGTIAELGTHEELMAAGGAYAQLYGIQSSYYS